MSSIEGRDSSSVIGRLAGPGLGLLALIGGGILVVLVFSVFVLHGDNYRLLLPTRAPPPADWTAYRGDISFDDEGAVIHGLSPRGVAIVAIPLYRPVNPRHLERVELTYQTPQAAHRVQLGLLPSGERQGNPPIVPFTLSGHGEGQVPAETLRQVQGEVSTVFIIYQARFVDDVRINTLRFVPSKPGLTELYARIWADWVELAPWRQTSINFIRVGEERPLVSPVVAAAVWGGATLMLLGLARLLLGRRGRRFRWSAGLLVTVAVCWLALDLRWQADLLYKVSETAERFAGKTPDAKRRADIDGDLYAFVARAKEMMGEERSRVFIRGAGEFRYLRARYHALPYPAEASERSLVRWAAPYMRPTDYVMLLDDAAVQVGRISGGDEQTRAIRFGNGNGETNDGDIHHKERRKRDAWYGPAQRFEPGFYIASWTVRAPKGNFRGQARVFGEAANGERVMLAKRELRAAAGGEVKVSLPVAIPKPMRMGFRLRSDAPVTAITVRPMVANEALRYLSDEGGPPYVVVEALLSDGQRRLFSVR